MCIVFLIWNIQVGQFVFALIFDKNQAAVNV